MKKLLILPLLFLLLCSVCLADDTPVFFGDEVVVTASKFLQRVKSTFPEVSVINSRQIEKSGALTVSDALRSCADVTVKNNGGPGGISTIKLRSAASEQVLVLLNGVRLNSSLLGLVDLNDISVQNIDRIEIVKEPVSVLYGSDAMGGVINIITKAGDKPYSLSLKFGSFGENTASVGTSGKAGPVKYNVSLQQGNYDGFRTNSYYRSKGAALGIDVADVLVIKYNLSSSQRGNPGVPTSDTDPSSSSTPDDWQKDMNNDLAISMGLVNSDSLKMKLNLSKAFSDEWTHYADGFIPNLFYDDQYLSSSSAAELLNDIRLNSFCRLDIGLESRRNEATSAKAGMHYIDNNSVSANAYVGEGLPAGATLGVRLDKNSMFGDEINPRVGFLISAKDLTIRTSVSSAFRAPTLNELFYNDPAWMMYGNPNLKPEKSVGVNIEAEKDLGIFTYSADYYENNISDMIKWVPTGIIGYQAVNIDRAKVEGFGVELKKEVPGILSVRLSRNFENAVDTLTSKQLTYSPVYKTDVDLSVGNLNCLEMDVNSSSVSDVYDDPANTRVVPGHTVVNLGFSKTIGMFEVNAVVKNLFNAQYFESMGFSSVDFKERGYPMPGRTFEVGVKI